MIIEKTKKIVLIAHDNKKDDLLAWAKFNKGVLIRHSLYGSGSTGKIIRDKAGLEVELFKSGPLGGDLQVGAAVAEGNINFLIFFWDPLEPLPHDPDIKALLRIAVMYNIPIASNRATADFLISSPLMNDEYDNETTEEVIKKEIEKIKKKK
jgi:methylglyoxal synthase